MAAATCLEMGFLGLTFSATIAAKTRSMLKHLALLFLPVGVWV